MTNIGLDRVDDIVLRTERPLSHIARLTPNGDFVPCTFTVRENGDTVIDTPADILTPVVLMLTER